LHLMSEGRVVNRTMNQPSPGDEVRLFDMAQPSARKLALSVIRKALSSLKDLKPLLLWWLVVHQNVVYHSSLLAGSEPFDVADV